MDRPTRTRMGNLTAVIGVAVAIIGFVMDDGIAIVIVGAVLVVLGLALVAHARRPSRAVVSAVESKVEQELVDDPLDPVDPHERARPDYTGI